MSRTSPITQSAIAELAGVTRLTVRRALQGQPGVGPQTAQRIRNLAREHGYLPNAAANATRTGRFHAVGLVIGSVTPRYLPAELVHGVEKPLVAAGYQLLFASLSDRAMTRDRLTPRMLQQLMVDGLLLHYTHDFPSRLPDLVQHNRVPTIWINTKLEHDCVYLDDRAAAYRATRTLLEHGHRRIGYVNCDRRGHYSETDRLGGYQQAMREAGLEPVTRVLAYPPHDQPGADDRYARARAWLDGPDRPTAVLAYSGSNHAGPIAAAALSLGLAIPRDLSLVSFDRVEFSPVGIPLSCVSTSMEPAGRVAVQLLQRKMDHPDQLIPAREITPELSHLASITAPPASGLPDHRS